MCKPSSFIAGLTENERICEACILKYDSKELGIDDVTETEDVIDEL